MYLCNYVSVELNDYVIYLLCKQTLSILKVFTCISIIILWKVQHDWEIMVKKKKCAYKKIMLFARKHTFHSIKIIIDIMRNKIFMVLVRKQVKCKCAYKKNNRLQEKLPLWDLNWWCTQSSASMPAIFAWKNELTQV